MVSRGWGIAGISLSVLNFHVKHNVVGGCILGGVKSHFKFHLLTIKKKSLAQKFAHLK
jgi:hypothetical protein